MAEVRLIPPSDEIKGLVGAIPGVRFTPGVVVGQDGPECRVGPEGAGAILVLHTTAADDDAAERFWRTTTAVKQQLPGAAGFIRLFSLFDGLSGYLVAFWRTVEDAQAFAAGHHHRAAVAALRRERFEYSHFVGLWKAHAIHPRTIYCELCGTATPVPTDACSSCANPLHDVFGESRPPATDRAAATPTTIPTEELPA